MTQLNPHNPLTSFGITPATLTDLPVVENLKRRSYDLPVANNRYTVREQVVTVVGTIAFIAMIFLLDRKQKKNKRLLQVTPR